MTNKDIDQKIKKCNSCGQELSDSERSYCDQCIRLYVFLKAREEIDYLVDQKMKNE